MNANFYPFHHAVVLAVAAFASCTVMAGDTPEDTIRAALKSQTDGKVTITNVAKSPVAGVYEVTAGMEIFYVDSSGRYGFVDGRLVDMKERKDLTAIQLDKIMRIRFADLPLDLAQKTVHGNGKRVVAIFEDPACPICKALHKFIAQLPDATIYTFMYPVVSPDSIPKAQAAWCAPDPSAAWSRLMEGGSAPEGAPCDVSGLGKIAALGDKLNIAGTPTVFLSNGRRLVGATPPDQLMAAIDDATNSKK